MDNFEDIVSGIQITEPEEVYDVTKLSDETLFLELARLEDELFHMGEALKPKTQKARDLHSERNAIWVEIHRRSRG